MKKTTLVVVFAMFLIGLSTSAFATPVVGVGTATTVSANANIFGAVSLTGAGDGSGTTPTEVTGITGGNTYDVTGVSGTVTCGSFCSPAATAGGGVYSDLPLATNITAPGNGISGISLSPDYLFLVGVFINSSAPPSSSTTAPMTLGYGNPSTTTNNATDAPSFEPLLNQVFYIGGGTEGSDNGGACPGGSGTMIGGFVCTNGMLQTIAAPTGANELFLGFAEASGGSGTPGSYNGATGSLNATVNLFSSSTPEPGTMMLMGLGLAACALLRKKLA